MRSARTIMLKIQNLDRIAPNGADKSIYDFKPSDIVEWRNKRKKEVKVSTLRNEHAIYSAVFTYALKELFLIESNVWQTVPMPSKERSRNQRIMPEQQEVLLKALDWDGVSTPEKSKHYVAWAFLFALETAMREGEILAMRRSDLRDGFVHLPMTKNGESRNVPLSKEAKRLLLLLPFDSDVLVPINEFKDWCLGKYEYQSHDEAWLQALTYEKQNRSHEINKFAKQAFDEVVKPYGYLGSTDTFYKVYSSVYKRIISKAKERNEADELLEAIAQCGFSGDDLIATVSELCKTALSNLSLRTAQRYLKSLEQAGYIKRKDAGFADESRFFLTDKAKQLFEVKW